MGSAIVLGLEKGWSEGVKKAMLSEPAVGRAAGDESKKEGDGEHIACIYPSHLWAQRLPDLIV